MVHRPRVGWRWTRVVTMAITAKIKTGTGTGPTSEVARLLKESGTPVTGDPPATTFARPRPMYMVPRVVITGLIFIPTIRNALRAPMAPPARMPMRNAHPRGQWTSATNLAAVTPATAMMEPMDRSRPPATMTGVTRHADIPMKETWPRTLVMLFTVVNSLVWNDSHRLKTMRMPTFMTSVLLVGRANQIRNPD